MPTAILVRANNIASVVASMGCSYPESGQFNHVHPDLS